MLGYLNYIRISDGQHSVRVDGANEITIRNAKGETTKVLTGDFDTGKERNSNYSCTNFILGHETKSKTGALIERERYGVEYRNADVQIPYSAKTWNGIHGTIKRRTEILKAPCVIHTIFKRGRFIQQSAYWRNGVTAYQFKRGDTALEVRYPRGTPALKISKLEIDYKEWNITERLKAGVEIFEKLEHIGESYTFIEYDRVGRIKNKGAYKNRQKTGKWVIAYKKQAYLNGLMVDAELLEAKPESISVRRILKEQNAQIRAMLIEKVGYKRLVAEIKAKTIHSAIDKAGNPMTLLELPIGADDGNGNSNGSRVRVLSVVCPSTKANYILGVPDFTWDNGAKTPISTCEQAKLWGFQNNESEVIKWVKET